MHLLYVDDEEAARKKFVLVASKLDLVEKISVATSGAEAMALRSLQDVTVAFLDIEMPEMKGTELAQKLHEVYPLLKVVFLTAYNNYATEAFAAEAVGYLLKPYDQHDIEKILLKITGQQPNKRHDVYVTFMPWFDLYIDGEIVIFGRSKIKEMLAYILYQDGKGVSTETLTKIIWPNKPVDEASMSLCRNTFKRLKDTLENLGIPFIIYTAHFLRFAKKDSYHTDVEKLLAGDEKTLREYDGRFLTNYTWAHHRQNIIQVLVAKMQSQRKVIRHEQYQRY